MKQIWISLSIALAALGCAAARAPESGSQTHFLETCSASCAAPYQCLCGACSLACDTDRACSSHAKSASCVQAIDGDGHICKSATQVCDVECENDIQCGALAASYSCQSGRCRTRATSASDAGAIRAGGSGGRASGGQGGTGGDGSAGRIDPGRAGTVAASAGQSGGGTAGCSGACPLANPICDGSDDARLAITQSAGFTDSIVQFTNPLGEFVFVDGKCNYYATTNYMNGIYLGTLSDVDAAQLASDVHFSTFSEIAGRPPANCADGGTLTITVRGSATACDCGSCGNDSPAGRQAAIDAAGKWLTKLTTTLPPKTLDGPVTAALRLDPTQDQPGSPPATWGIAPLIADTPKLIISENMPFADQGVLFEMPRDTDRLRSLRLVAAAANAPPQSWIRVQDQQNSAIYELFVRDDLPPAVETAFTDLINSSGSL